jgi:hypothetical protein
MTLTPRENRDAHRDDVVGYLGVLADEAVEGVADGFEGEFQMAAMFG